MANKDILPIQLFLFAMLITIPVYAQWEEIPIDPQYTLKNFPLEERSWFGINEKILFLEDCGWLSTIVALLYTDNGGDDWRELERFPNWITDFHFVNTKEGWLTSGGELWHTRDGGETWTQLPIELDAEEVPWNLNVVLRSLTKIYFFDSNYGVGVFQWRFDFFLGDARVIVATTQDGGRHWRARKWVEFGDIIISWEIVGNRIWIPMWPEIWFSPDRGESWKKLTTPMGLYAFNFLEPNDGWSVVVGMSPQLFHTRDNGESWQFISELPPIYGQKGELLFVSDRKGWLLSFPLFDGRRYHAVLWQTQDGGIHWQSVE